MEEKDINKEEELLNEEEMEDTQETQATPEEAEATEEEQEATEEAEAPAEPSLEEENAKLRDQLLRTMAEFDNFKKRTLREKTELILNGSEKTVTAILPILDDFERALADTHTDDAQAVKEGMDLIFKKFIKTLESLGVKKIDTEGQDFDVDFHEAIAMVPGMGDDKKGKVIDCVQTGYTLNDKVIRHAKVAVGQ